MSEGLNLSVKQWEVLGAAPALVFVLVAKSDGVISVGEEDALVKDWLPRILSLRFSSLQKEQKVYQWAVGEATVNMHGLFVMSDEDLGARLKASVAIIDDHVPPAKAETMRATLKTLARDVAKSCGGRRGVFKKKLDPVSREEGQAIRLIDHILRGRPVL